MRRSWAGEPLRRGLAVAPAVWGVADLCCGSGSAGLCWSSVWSFALWGFRVSRWGGAGVGDGGRGVLGPRMAVLVAPIFPKTTVSRSSIFGYSAAPGQK